MRDTGTKRMAYCTLTTATYRHTDFSKKKLIHYLFTYYILIVKRKYLRNVVGEMEGTWDEVSV
jgi:hypothetical protein